ncbi:hypothetical protein [Hominenteromicrobium sp.]|uniref:hypothetical protein n=1 Tax=Hominenteromicrobium sp. TaxID=3073581 RepID=UPI00399A59D6
MSGKPETDEIMAVSCVNRDVSRLRGHHVFYMYLFVASACAGACLIISGLGIFPLSVYSLLIQASCADF